MTIALSILLTLSVLFNIYACFKNYGFKRLIITFVEKHNLWDEFYIHLINAVKSGDN